jgi:hypothetical protein
MLAFVICGHQPLTQPHLPAGACFVPYDRKALERECHSAHGAMVKPAWTHGQ